MLRIVPSCRVASLGGICVLSFLCTGCEPVGALAEIAGETVTGIARVASGAIFQGQGRRSANVSLRMTRPESMTGGLLADVTKEGTARAILSLDEAGRVFTRGQHLGTIDARGVLRLRTTPSVPIRIERGAILEAGRAVGRASVIALSDEVAVRSSPLTTARVVATLRRGAIAEVSSIRDGWYRIRNAQAPEGWVPVSALAVQLTTIETTATGEEYPTTVALVPESLISETRTSIRQVVNDIDRILGGKE